MAFHGKTVVITGGVSGIGKTHALQLANPDVSVFVLDIDEEGLENISSFSSNIVPVKCDVSKLEDVQRTIRRIEKETGSIDRLIHCAAIMPGGLLSEVTAQHITKVTQVNYIGMVNTVQTVLPFFLERNSGDIIVYGSIAGIVRSKRFGVYGATKSATNFYMKVLMAENESSNIRFLLVCPPSVDTPLINQAKEKGPHFLKDIQKSRKNLVTPESVVFSVEKSLENGDQICYPGPAKWIQFLYPLFPKIIDKAVNAERG